MDPPVEIATGPLPDRQRFGIFRLGVLTGLGVLHPQLAVDHDFDETVLGVGAAPQMVPAVIAASAKRLKSRREVIVDQPLVKSALSDLSPMLVPAAVDMVDLEEVDRCVPAAGADLAIVCQDEPSPFCMKLPGTKTLVEGAVFAVLSAGARLVLAALCTEPGGNLVSPPLGRRRLLPGLVGPIVGLGRRVALVEAVATVLPVGLRCLLLAPRTLALDDALLVPLPGVRGVAVQVGLTLRLGCDPWFVTTLRGAEALFSLALPGQFARFLRHCHEADLQKYMRDGSRR
jgi:hypothetical protein